MESLSKRLIGSKGKLLVTQGDVPKGPYTIVYGIIKHVDHPRTVERWHSRTYKSSIRYVPSELRDVSVPTQPILYCGPVLSKDKTSIQKLLKDLEFEHYTGNYAFYSKSCKTPINPIIHMGLPNFKQDYVARVYIEERMKDILWPPEKVSPRDLGF
jgi:hypothetical protein